ncbi:MAG: SLC13 family permease [Bacteroidales bacterium]|nr:SLC13 family permease [Bacteroidales bacterium]
MITTLIILLVAVIFFAIGKIRSDIVALCALAALLIFQILTPEEGLSGFANSTVIMMAGLFIVGEGILRTGLARIISSKLLDLAGSSQTKLFLLVMLVTCLVGAFVSNTGTVALMLPIVVSVANNAKMNPSRILMPVAFASSLGGMMTLIGTPSNMIVSDLLVSAGYKGLSFFSFLPTGLVCVVVGTLILLPLTKWFLSKERKKENDDGGKSLDQLVKEYGLSKNLFRVRMDESSASDGKTVGELGLGNIYGLNLLEIRRGSGFQHRFLKTVTTEAVSPDTVIYAGDVLYLKGEEDGVNRFIEECEAKMVGGDDPDIQDDGLYFYDVGIAETLLMPSSGLINKTVQDIGFRQKYNLNVLGIRRGKNYLHNDLADVKVRESDVLLVQGAWGDIARLSREDNDFVVLGQPQRQAEKVTVDRKAPVAGGILILMVILMVFDFIPIAPVTAVLIASILMILTGCVRSVEAAYKAISWQTIFLIAAMIPMSLALEKTGVSDIISNSLINVVGGHGPIFMIAAIYIVTSIMTFFLSNTVTTVLMGSIAMQCAMTLGLNPVPFVLAVAIGASMSFSSPFSTPANALVTPVGQYTFMDFIKVGLPTQIVIGVAVVLVLPLIFPL